MIKHLYQPAAELEVKERLARLRTDSARQWGKMTPAQTLAHCSLAFQMALGELNPPRIWLGRIVGRMAKRSLIDRGEPMRRDSVTAASLVVREDRDLDEERDRLRRMIDRFITGGPAECTRYPHCFLGPLTPVEWAALMYQHLDHHLRQFGA